MNLENILEKTPKPWTESELEGWLTISLLQLENSVNGQENSEPER